MFHSTSRRRFLAGSLAGGVGALLSPALYAGKAQASQARGFSFWQEYYDGASTILTGIRDTQLERIKREMQTAYERSRKGGTIYSQITAGHFPTEETALDRIGQPGVFAFLERNAKEEVYAGLKPNDMIITNTIHLGNIEAMKRGIRVLGVTVNYYPFSKTPPGEGYQIEYEGRILRIEDTASEMIDSQIPWDNGLVHPPQIDFAVLPSGGMSNAVIYWMCAAEFTGLKANKGKTADIGWAEYYINTCIERAEMVGKDFPKFAVVGKELADLVFRGARWWCYGANHALPSDAVGVANGPRITRMYEDGQVKKGDIVLIGAYTSNNPEELAVARECRRKGAYVLAITPFSEDGDASGLRLFKEVDFAFNTYSPESWGVVPIKSRELKVCPTTGVIGDLVLWLLVAQWVDEMSHRGEFPYFWKGFFMKNGGEYNNAISPYYEARGW